VRTIIEKWACARCSGSGRMLTIADLRPCRWNLYGQPYSWFDLFAEMEGAPPRNLAKWCNAGEPGEFAPLCGEDHAR